MIATLAALAVLSSSQTNQMTVDYASLLDMKIYPGNGAIQLERLYVLFPDLTAKYKAVVHDASTEYGTFPMRIEAQNQSTVGRLDPDQGANGVVLMNKEGSFTLDLYRNEEVFSSIDFTLRAVQIGADEFTRKTIYVMDGPWRKYAAFVAKTDTNTVKLRAWVSTGENNRDKQMKCSMTILRNGSPIGMSKDFVVSSWAWGPIDFTFDRPDGRTAFLLSDLLGTDGAIEVVYKLDGERVRSMKCTVAGGQIKPLAENAIDFAPHTRHIAPRTVTSTANDNVTQGLHTLYWISSQ